MASRQLCLTFQEQIKSRHEQNQKIDSQLREVLLKKLNSVRELGVLIGEASAALDKSQFAQMTKECGIDSNALRAYVGFATEHRDGPITEVAAGMKSMRGLMLALQSGGLLPFAAEGHGIQRLHQNPSLVQQVIATAAGLAHKIRQQLKSHPLPDWTEALSSI